MVTTELEYYRKSHDIQMDKFDKKFTEFQTELTELTDQNLIMKDKEKRSKKKINELEVQIVEMKERSKYLQQKNSELVDKMGYVENDYMQMQRDTEMAKLNQA